jgi:hypothetical protein
MDSTAVFEFCGVVDSDGRDLCTPHYERPGRLAPWAIMLKPGLMGIGNRNLPWGRIWIGSA